MGFLAACVPLPLGVSVHTTEVRDAIGRAATTQTARVRGLHDMCSLSRKSCTTHLVYVQVIENMEKLTPETQKELAL